MAGAIFDTDFSRPLNTAIWTEDPDLVGLTQKIWDEYLAAGEAEKQKGGKKPKRSYVEQLRVLVTELYLAWHEDFNLCLGMNFSQGAWDSRSRYNPLGLSKHFIVLVKQLQAARLVRVSAGSYAAPGAKGNRTGRIQASWELQKRFELLDVDHRAIWSIPAECIVLKEGLGEASKVIEYQDTDATNRMRQELTAYNDLLAQTFIDIPTLEEPWVTTWDSKGRERRISIGPRHQHIRRIFSRGSWELNGRFYGPWWQGLNSGLRSQIFINDTPTVEIDFKAMHIQILAAQKGVELPPDPYALPEGQFPGIEAAEQRKLVKLLVLTALNARNLNATCSAFRDSLSVGHPAKKLKNKALEKVLTALTERLPFLEDTLSADKGIGLMFTDSQILGRVIDQCTAMSLPILTVHDSVIVPYTHTKLVHQAMEQAANELVGRVIPLETQYRGLDEWQHELPEVQLDFEAWRETPREQGYLQRLSEWEETTGKEVRSFRFSL
ncbi:hypothetical protein [Paracoccus sp. (in: a-proteobacteria)]|uniref:hypothetical protein n=1 Tax=Paracoccus sp. TaxID=267 RepID=UPI0028A1DA8D|nr:hypothetical protein [Paracoccus sp. (in: a-proteobacteria)]